MESDPILSLDRDVTLVELPPPGSRCTLPAVKVGQSDPVLVFRCECRQLLSADYGKLGELGSCPACGHWQRVPFTAVIVSSEFRTRCSLRTPPVFADAVAVPAGAASESFAEEWKLPETCFEAGNPLGDMLLPLTSFRCYFLVSDTTFPVRLWPDKNYTLGRAHGNDIALPELDIADQHVAFQFVDGSFRMRCTDGQKAVVNGAPVSEHELLDMDRIELGGITHVFLAGPEEYVTKLVNVQYQNRVAARKLAASSLVEGSLSEVRLGDLLQFLCTTRKTGTLTITYGESVGTIHLQEGNVTFAEVAGLAGAEAVYAMVAYTTGTFHFTAACKPRKKNVTSTTVMLVLEAMRRLDERRTNDSRTSGRRPTQPQPVLA